MRKLFNLVPSGIVQGGSLEYEIKPAQNLILYVARVRARKWGITKDVESSGSQNVNMAELESAKYGTVGAQFRFANLMGRVISIKGLVATTHVTLMDMDASGVATFDLSGQYVELLHMEAAGSAKVPIIGKIDFRLILVPAVGPLASKNKTRVPTPEDPNGSPLI